MSTSNQPPSDNPKTSAKTIASLAVRFVALLAILVAWALIPGTVITGLFILRTSKEDRMLSKELEGYEAYTHKVRYRLQPGIW